MELKMAYVNPDDMKVSNQDFLNYFNEMLLLITYYTA